MRQWILDPHRSVPLSVGQILGVQDLGPCCLSGLDHQSIPKRDLVPRFQVQRLQNRVAPVYDNLPREVVGHDVTRGLRVQGLLRLSSQIDGQFLQDLSADDTRPALPQLFNERLRARVLWPVVVSWAYMRMFVSTKYLSLMELVA